MAADPQRTTSFGNSAGQLPQQQPVSTNGGNQSPMMGPSMGEAFNNPNNMGFYRNLELPPNVGPGQGAIFPPEVPNFYFNAGFNKGIMLIVFLKERQFKLKLKVWDSGSRTH